MLHYLYIVLGLICAALLSSFALLGFAFGVIETADGDAEQASRGMAWAKRSVIPLLPLALLVPVALVLAAFVLFR